MNSSMRLVIILCLISSLGRFVLDSYLPSLPAIAQYFHLSTANSEYTLTYYLIGFSFSQLLYGPLSDHYGRKKILLLGLIIFGLGNFFCAIANSSHILFAARFLAGTGAGACGVLNRAIASDYFQGREFAKIWSYTTSSLVLTLCIAPILGGYIQETQGWHMNFMLSTGYVSAVFIIVLLFFSEKKITDAQIIKTEKAIKIKQILKNYSLILQTQSFLKSALCYTFAFSGIIIYFQLSPLLLIDNLHLLPSQYGWSALLIALIYLTGGSIVNYFVPRCGTRWLIMIGAFLLVIGGVSLLIITALNYQSLAAILLPSSIYILGARIIIPNTIANSMEELRHLNGSSSAMIGCLQMLGSSLISYFVGNFNASLHLLGLVFTCLGFTTLIFAYKTN